MLRVRGASPRGAAFIRIALGSTLALTGLACASATEVGRLEAEIRRLQAQVDDAQKREAETQVRLQELREKAAAAGVPGAAAPSEPVDRSAEALQPPVEKPAAGASPHEMYNAAFTKYNLGQHLEAILLFHTFLATYPRHDLADNAQYWIGECYFARKEYERAAEEFQKVVDDYPQGNKVPDAFVKKGLSLLALNRRDEAIESLRAVIESYPKSDAAAYARQRLNEIHKKAR